MTTAVVPAKMVMPRCRDRLTPRDRRFVAAVLGGQSGSVCARDLLRDPEARDIMLDEPALCRQVQRWHRRYQLSSRLVYYVTLRQALRARGLDDRELTDYVAELLVRRGRYERHTAAGWPPDGLSALFALMRRLPLVLGEERCRTCWYLGDLALYLAGICPERLRRRRPRGLRRAPGLTYIETLGRANYLLASRQETSRERQVCQLLRRLAYEFRRLRLALNELGEQGVLRVC